MKLRLLFSATTALMLMSSTSSADTRPNILVILADDLGYSDIGATGGEIATPNIDALAREGRILTSMYSTSMPTSRAALLTGADPHLVGYGSMGPPAGKQIGKPGYERHLNDRSVTIAELLRDGGYRTYMVGTWGMGFAESEGPHARGFDSSYALIEAAADYFQPESHRLSKTESITYRENGVTVTPPDRYVTDLLTDKLIGFIDAHGGAEKPFFAYASYSAPHFPLQATDEDMERQRGKYDAGYDTIRLARIEKQKRLGLFSKTFSPAVPVGEEEGFKLWKNLSAQERKAEARRMEIYAAMIERLDANIGRLLAHLKKIRKYDNTFVVFTSGNGAADTWRTRRKPEDVDNSYENMGKRHSWLSYSERWAEVSNTPFSLWKGKMTEGGIAVPTIVRVPGQSKSTSTSDAAIAFQDLAPTFLALANLPRSGKHYRGRAAIPMSGTSVLPLLQGKTRTVHPLDAVFAAENGGEAYVRQGEWKAVRIIYAAPDTELHRQELAALAIGDLATASRLRAQFPRVWRLYNIKMDRGETVDLSKQRKDVLARMQNLFERYAESVGVVDP